MVRPGASCSARSKPTDAFRARVAERFLARDDAVELLDHSSARDALVLTDGIARDGKLALLASTLYAARPVGWTFGLGVAFATAARGAEDAQLQAEAHGRAAELAAAAEARRRADAARARADEQRARAEAALRAERQSRRDALTRAEEERDDALQEAADARRVSRRGARRGLGRRRAHEPGRGASGRPRS